MTYPISREYLIKYGKPKVKNINHEEYSLGNKIFVCGWCSPRIIYKNGYKEFIRGGWQVYEIG